MSAVGHGHTEHGEGKNKKIALLISVLALLLAFCATLAKSAQTSAISYNIEASNMWAFFQAKTIRMTAVRTAAEGLEAGLPGVNDPKPQGSLREDGSRVGKRLPRVTTPSRRRRRAGRS